MDFLTIGQYFNKLFSALLVILLAPIVAFIVIYLGPGPADPDGTSLTLSGFLMLAIVVIDWLIIFISFDKKIKSIRNGQGLRIKLEKYYRLTIVRYMLAAGGCLVLASGFYFTGDDVFTGIFVASLVATAALWPTSPKVCNDLKLKGDEREMVYYKKDDF